MAKFKINKTFNLTNRGSVIAGEIVEGEINSGYMIRFETDGQITELKIKSVEFLLVKHGHEQVALMLGLINNSITKALEKMVDEIVYITPK